MKIRNLLVCSALAFAPACKGGGSNDAVEKMVSMLEDMGKAVDAAGGDCPKMADGVQAVVNKYEGSFKDMKAAGEKIKGDKAATEEMMKKYGDRMQKAMPAMMGMAKCADDPKMKEIQKKLDGFM